MKRFLFRIIVCLVPTLASIGVVAYAYNEYQAGRGGFVLGVDLVGGTILVYEVDESKMTPEARSTFKVEDLAQALKRRIDPNDLYNVTVRPIGGTPERVEIILPTGGAHQARIEKEKWTALLADAKTRGKLDQELETRQGDRSQLVDDVTRAKRAQIEAEIKKQQDEKVDWAKIVENAKAEILKGDWPLSEQRTAADLAAERAAADAALKNVTKDSAADLAERVAGALRPQISLWVEEQVTRNAGKNKKMFTGDEVEHIKNLIARQGRLEFRILANGKDDSAALEAAQKYFATTLPVDPRDPASKPRDPDAARIVQTELARATQRAEPPPSPRADGNAFFTVKLGGEEVGHTYSWIEMGKSYLYSRHLNTEALAEPRNAKLAAEVAQAEKTGQPFLMPLDEGVGNSCLIYVRPVPESEWARRNPKDRQLGKKREFFILVRDPVKGKEITGDYLVKAYQTFDQNGKPAIGFTFNSEGGRLFYEVTSQNRPTDIHRFLAVIFDAQVEHAPSLREAIRQSGQISGNYTQPEIDDMLRLLRAGALPATLKKDPSSENSMGATLGDDTIKWGFRSVIGAFLAVMLFMVFYYRFAGLVACVALLANLLLTVAFMVLVQAAFTLPGLAGLVLMLGMAVDANVLIYERLREERDRGASLSLALRNGYDRAFPTILDTHLASIFTAVVLWFFGNDQLKGFGVSLTAGLIISLFTSLYVTRTLFEIWLYKGWMTNLTFFNGLVRLIHARYWDFMSIRHYWFAGTLALTILGGALFIYRADSNPDTGKATVLNIDFTGGTAYAGRLNEGMELKDLRAKLSDPPLPDMSIVPLSLSREDAGDGKVRLFEIRTSEKDPKKVFKHVTDRLEGNLVQLRLNQFAVESGKAGATGARLAFANEKKEVAFASQAQVQRLLTNAFLARSKSPSSFSVEHPEKRELTWDKVVADATAAFPVAEGKPPYSDVKADDARQANLAKAIYDHSAEPRVKAWFAEKVTPFDATKLSSPKKEEREKAEKEWEAIVTSTANRFPPEKGKENDYKRLEQADKAKGDPKKMVQDLQTAALNSVDSTARRWVEVALTGAVDDKDKASRRVEQEGHYAQLTVRLSEPMEPAELETILQAVQKEFADSAQPERLEVFDSQLARNMQERAMYAILASWGAILLYLWFRFGSWTFGAAAVCCLLHDLFFTLGVIAACHYLHEWPLTAGIARFLLIEDFKIDLNAVAALLTLVGYSVNDTIVVFDRIREVRGKNPLLTAQMINDSVNQTLTRTILASTTVMVVVIVLYLMGGPVLRLFAFVMIVGVVVGTYSSIYIASPLLLIFGEGRAKSLSPVALDRPPAVANTPRLQSGGSTGIQEG